MECKKLHLWKKCETGQQNLNHQNNDFLMCISAYTNRQFIICFFFNYFFIFRLSLVLVWFYLKKKRKKKWKRIYSEINSRRCFHYLKKEFTALGIPCENNGHLPTHSCKIQISLCEQFNSIN